ncbi:MAG: hypothetical protein HYZ26_12295 [Chloroflexi bacterium]|nr:hypothetical protein [Chloroflexota bacterium]
MAKLSLAIKILATAAVMAGAAYATPAVRGRVTQTFDGAVKALGEIALAAGTDLFSASAHAGANAAAQSEGGITAEGAADGESGTNGNAEGDPENTGSGFVMVQVGAAGGGLAGLFGDASAGLVIQEQECAGANAHLTLAWDPEVYLSAAGETDGVFHLYRDGGLLAELDSQTRTYVDVFPSGEEHIYRLEFAAGGTIYWQEAEGGCG